MNIYEEFKELEKKRDELFSKTRQQIRNDLKGAAKGAIRYLTEACGWDSLMIMNNFSDISLCDSQRLIEEIKKEKENG